MIRPILAAAALLAGCGDAPVDLVGTWTGTLRVTAGGTDGAPVIDCLRTDRRLELGADGDYTFDETVEVVDDPACGPFVVPATVITEEAGAWTHVVLEDLDGAHALVLVRSWQRVDVGVTDPVEDPHVVERGYVVVAGTAGDDRWIQLQGHGLYWEGS